MNWVMQMVSGRSDGSYDKYSSGKGGAEVTTGVEVTTPILEK